MNKLDRSGADFYRVVKQVRTVLGAKALVMVLPIGTEGDFVGVVDLLTRKAYVWDDSGLPENFKVGDVPGRHEGHRREVPRRADRDWPSSRTTP